MGHRRISPLGQLGLTACVGGLAVAGGARAEGVTTVSAKDFAKLQAQVAEQAKQIAAQREEIEQLKAEKSSDLAAVRAGAGRGATSEDLGILRIQAQDAPGGGAPPTTPVGEAPAPVPVQERSEAAAIPPQLGVLTPKGRLILDPSIEYDRTAANRIVFRGVVIVPGVNLGLVEANEASRDMGVATLALRYGLTSRLELEARVPYVYRHDMITTVAAEANQFERNSSIYGHGLGDVEVAARYQLNHGQNGWPFFVLTSRVKTATGAGPYDVNYDEDAVALELPTGSGFLGVEGGVTMLYPTDPAIIFGSLTYLHNFSKNVNKTFGTKNALFVGEVDPGDSIGASIGFGLSLNSRFSVSFGYQHNYIMSTEALEGDPNTPLQKVTFRPLQAGSLLMGASFRLKDRLTLNGAFQFGVTADAPDLQLTFRVPYRF